MDPIGRPPCRVGVASVRFSSNLRQGLGNTRRADVNAGNIFGEISMGLLWHSPTATSPALGIDNSNRELPSHQGLHRFLRT